MNEQDTKSDSMVRVGSVVAGILKALADADRRSMTAEVAWLIEQEDKRRRTVDALLPSMPVHGNETPTPAVPAMGHTALPTT